MTSTTLAECFDRIAIINLPSRADRRREMRSELSRLGLEPKAGQIDFFPAVRATAVEDWPSLGARGCFQSHYQVLKAARDSGLRAVLVIEDDCCFTPELIARQAEVAALLSGDDWDIVHLGHVEAAAMQDSLLRPWDQPVMTAHLYAVHRNILPRLVEYLEQVMARPNGHPEGGPQHYDGALCMFRDQNPDVRTWIGAPNLATQRSSRSDIHGQWWDRMPVVRTAVNVLRMARRMLR